MKPRGALAAALAAPWLWLLVFLVAPLLIVLKIALAEPTLAAPPFTALLERLDDGMVALKLSFRSFALLAEDSLYWRALLNSIAVAATSTAICLVIGYPLAYGVARAEPRWRGLLLILAVLPFWTSFLLRVYAWKVLLQQGGAFNALLLWAGVIDRPLQLLYTPGAVHLGIVYAYLPFMVLPLYASLARQEPALLEAAADLGARPFAAFLRITLPLSLPGIVAGSLLVFIPAVGEFVIPELLGGPDSLMIGRTLWTEFFSNRDWPLASALALALLVVLLAPILWLQRHEARLQEAR
jgi:putrescine transport system permease protein